MYFVKKGMFRFFLAAICAVILFAVMERAALAACEGVVNTEGVNLRSSNSTTSDVVTTLSKGTKVSVSSTKDGWYHVSASGKSGYIRKDKLDLGTSGQRMYVAKADINLRAKANTDCEVVSVLALGQRVSIKDVSGDWYKVSADGASGYIRSDLLTASKPSQAAEQEPVTEKAAPEAQPVAAASDADGGAQAALLNAASGDAAANENADDGFDHSEDVMELFPESLLPATETESVSNSELQGLLAQLGFYSAEADSKFGAVSQAALMAFQRAYGLEIDGTPGAESLSAAQQAIATGGNGSSAGRVQVSSNGVILAEWFNYMKQHFPKYESLRCVDVQTGEEFHLRAFSCGNHADVEPPTKEDTDKLYKINGNKWSWDPRPIWVYIDGQAYAAVINVKPHGPDTLPDNGMSGQICMHFLHSRNHNTGKENKNMQAGILEAFEKAEQAPSPLASDYLLPPDLPQE